MERLEERLRQALDRSSQDAGYPQDLRRERLRRIRVLQATNMLLTTGVVAGALLVVVWGMGIGTGNKTTIPTNQSFLPQSLYVLDGAPGGLASEGAVVRVSADAVAAQVVQRYPLGAHPDAVLSPDGSRLYGVAFAFGAENDETGDVDVLRVFETATGRLIQEVDVSDYPGTTGFHVHQMIAVSPEGDNVYVVVGFPTTSDRPLSLATFDAASGSMLPEVTPLDGCGGWPILLPRSGPSLAVVCPGADDVRFIDMTDAGGIQAEQRLSLPTTDVTMTDEQGNTSEVNSVVDAVLSPDDSVLYAVTQDGLVFVINAVDGRLEQTAELQLPSGSLLAPAQIEIAPDGSVLFAGLHAGVDALHAEDILKVDTSTLQVTSTVDTPIFSAFAVSGDASRVFTIDYDTDFLEQTALDQDADLPPLGTVAGRPLAIYVGP